MCLSAAVPAERTWHVSQVEGKSDVIVATWSSASLDDDGGQSKATSCGECNSLDRVIQLAGDGDVVEIDGRRGDGVAYSLCHWAAKRRHRTLPSGDDVDSKSIIIRGVNGRPRLTCVDELIEVNRPGSFSQSGDPYGDGTEYNDDYTDSSLDGFYDEAPPPPPPAEAASAATGSLQETSDGHNVEFGQGRDRVAASKPCSVEWSNIEWFDVELQPMVGCDLIIGNCAFVEAVVTTAPECDRINVTISRTVFSDDDAGKSPKTAECSECANERHGRYAKNDDVGGDATDHRRRRHLKQGRRHADAIVLSCMTSLTLLVEDSELTRATLVVDSEVETKVRVSRTRFTAVGRPVTSYLSGLRLTLGRRRADVEITNCSFTGRKHSTMVN